MLQGHTWTVLAAAIEAPLHVFRLTPLSCAIAVLVVANNDNKGFFRGHSIAIIYIIRKYHSLISLY